MQNITSYVQNLPGAVWIIVGILFIGGIVMIARHGEEKYELSFFLSWSMALCLLSLIFLAGAGIYFANNSNGSVVPSNVLMNSWIVAALGLCSFIIAAVRNIAKSNIFFGFFYTLSQTLVAFAIVLVLFLMFSDNKKKQES